MDYEGQKLVTSLDKSSVAFSIIEEIQQLYHFTLPQIALFSKISLRTLYRVCKRQTYQLHPKTFQKLFGIYCLFCFVIPKNLRTDIKQNFFRQHASIQR